MIAGRFPLPKFLSFCFSVNLSAQQAVVSAGAEAEGSGGTASFSIGQVFYNVSSGNNGYIVQGVQQPYEISVISSIHDAENIKLTTSVFPNPVSEFLTLKIKDADFVTRIIFHRCIQSFTKFFSC